MALPRILTNPSIVSLATIFLILVPATNSHLGWRTRATQEDTGDGANWINHGGDLHNRRYASTETQISPKSVSNLSLKWTFHAEGDITATPAIFEGNIYFPSWDGYVYAVKASDGSLLWKQNIQNITGLSAKGLVANLNVTAARATPTIAQDMIIVGTYGPAAVIALKRDTGKLVWMTRVDDHNTSIVTMSGTYFKGGFYIGTSSLEESATIENCCTFRGSFLKLDVLTGDILWQTFMLPDNNGSRGEYAGAGIWGSSPSIDIIRNHIYIATGNLYSAPQHILECQEKENNQTVPTQPGKCVEPENHSNSMLALDLDTGEIKWYHQFGGYDVWFFACNNLSTPNCPPGPNPDADFGEAPVLSSVNKRDVAFAVQKSGFAWAVDRDNGSLIWSTEAGPGGTGGGGTWGAATDGLNLYTNIANSLSVNFTLKPSTKNTTSGGWVAMDVKTGEAIWSTANPSNATASGPVTVANGVVFAGSTNGEGPIYAMDAKMGKILWSYKTNATVYGGMSVSDGCVYVGNGYKVNFGFYTPSYTAGGTLFAFCV